MRTGTVRICGESVRVGDTVAAVFGTDKTVCCCAIVGDIVRIRAFDETLGDQLPHPQLWIKDARTRHLVGPIGRQEFQSIYPADGVWQTDDEVSAITGQPYESTIDQG